MSDYRKVLVTPDRQEPYDDRRTVDAVQKYASDNRWDHWVSLGDDLDFDFISKYSEQDLRLKADKSFAAQYSYSNDSLDRWLQAVRSKNSDCHASVIEGNHEYRVTKYIDKHPEHENSLEVALQLNLARRRVEWVPFWSEGATKKIGHAMFIHGRYVNEHHAKKHVLSYMCPVFYGHTHSVQEYSLVKQSKMHAIVGASLGCLCGPQQYMQGRPSNWQQAFGVFYFEKTGTFNYYIVRVLNHSFRAPDGKFYKG